MVIKVRAKAVKTPRAGGMSWATGVGVVFASSSRMSAVLTLDGNHSGAYRAAAAATFRLAARASELSDKAAEEWVIHVDSDGSLVIEMVKAEAAEQDRAIRLLVKLLEGVS